MKLTLRKMSRRRSRPARQPPSTSPTCCFCGFSEDDEVEYGKLWNHDGIVTHYYCLLLSSNMEQNGNDNEGILGFMPADIQKELRRGKRLACTFCRRAGATLGCCSSRCKRVFHLPCGLRAGSLHQFFGEFRSYCMTHRIKQEIDEHIKEEAAAAGTVTCYICYEEVNPQNSIRTLWAPCCRKNAWFHRKCVQRLALSAGYFFKCPLCNNKQEFQQAMLEHGIFIPNQDASWELVPNAYQELLHRHNRCDAVECLCPKGRSHTGVNAKWELVLCRLCGSQGVHKACGHLKLASSVWDCTECIGMLRKTNEATPGFTNQIIEMTNETSEDESSNDSDISVGRNPSPLPETDRPNSPSPAMSPVTSPVTSPIIKLRPGPRSFKVQQAVQNAKSAEFLKAGIAKTSVLENRDILLPNKSNTDENAISNEKSNGEASQATKSPADEGSLSLLLPSVQANGTRSEKSNISPETANAKSIEPRRREAEVIMIDSDDEVEIISVTPKQNILTTKDGTQIPIHSLFQVPGEPQKAEGDVKVAESTQSPISKQSSSKSNVSPATKSSIASDTSSHSNTLPRNVPPLFYTNVPKPPVTSRKTEQTKLMVVDEVVKQSSEMTFKITNVTSLRHEDFANTIQHSDVITKINIGGSGRGDLLQSNDQVRVTQITNAMNGMAKPHTAAFQLRTAAISDLNMKRKSEEFADNNSHSLSDKEVRKRARTCVSKNTEPVQNSVSIPWSIQFDTGSGMIPIHATSTSLTCSSNSNRFEQSTATMQTTSNDYQTNTRGGIIRIYNPDIQKRNGVYAFPPGTGSTNSAQNKTTNNTNHVSVLNHGLSPIVSQEKSPQVSVRKTYGLIQSQTIKRPSVQNMGANNTNIHDSTLKVNGSRNLSEVSSGLLKPQTTSQRIPNYSRSVAMSSQSVYQSHQDSSREMLRFRENGESFQTNLSATDALFYNGLPRNCTEAPTRSTRNQPGLNNVSKPSHSITQLGDGIPISSGCDGDAGSSPAAAAGPADQTASRSPVHDPTEPVSEADATSGAGENINAHTSISTYAPANRTNLQHDSSIASEGKYCDRHRMIPENVPLRNLKFRVWDPKIVQIVVYDTYVLNIPAETANRQNTQAKASPRGPGEKLKIFRSSSRQSNSISPKLAGIKNELNMKPDKQDDFSKSQKFSELADTPKELLVTLSESSRNPVVPDFKSNNSEILSTIVAITDNQTKTSRVLETKCDNKISSSYMNQASLAGNGSPGRIQKTNSFRESGEISASDGLLNRASFEGNVKDSSLQHKENLSKEEKVCPVLNKGRWSLKNLCERDDNIISVDNSQSFKVDVKESSVKSVKNENNVRSLSSVDFCTKIHNRSNDKAEKKRSIRLRRVSKCLVNKSIDNSSELNLSVECYNNVKKIVDRSSELDCNMKDFDANNIQDSLRNNAKNVTDLDAVNGSNKVSNSNESREIEIADTNSLANSSCSVNVESDIPKNKSINRAIEDRDSSVAAENTSSTCGSDLSINVRIDLSRIQDFIDSRPQLFDNHMKYRKRKLLNNEHESQSSPILVRTQNSQNPISNNGLSSSEIQTRQSVQNTGNLHSEKRCKYSPELYGKDSNN